MKEEKKDKIVELIEDKIYKPMTIKDLLYFLEVPQEDEDEFNKIIEELVNEYKIILTKKGRLVSLKSEKMCVGTFLPSQRGFGFVKFSDEEKDIFIHQSKINGAMFNDKVLVKIVQDGGNGKKKEGEVIKIISASNSLIVGLFEASKDFGFVVPDNQKIGTDIFIPRKGKNGAVAGHKVLVEITKPPKDGNSPEGKVVEIIGHINDPGVDILSIIYEYNLNLEFPADVMEEAKNISNEVLEEDLIGRTDYRHEQMVTIDGEDAKDLDDAINIKKLDNGNYLLGVHIADVTNYVKEGSPLDKEAVKRGTSVYLVDRVIPMLPHTLSNGICSLNAKVDRLALSCIMEIDQNGNVVNHKIEKTVININERMTYTAVNDILTNENSEYKKQYKDFIEMFETMESLRNILFKKRSDRGAIEFDFPESKIILEDGKPIDIVERVRNTATSIIEEFMLVCNETVAEEYYWMELPFVYRSHETPNEEKIEKLKDFIGYFGHYLKGKVTHPKSIQKLLQNIKDTEEEKIISKLILRSMKQAKYTASNGGHFGLSAKYYCHFTSPIRRYPDLQIHRIIKENIDKQLDQKRISKYSKTLEEIANECSVNERIAEEAERETIKLKKAEYMKEHIGEEFEGIVSSVTSWGIYVELPNTIEGMVSNNTLSDYVYDETNMQYVGEDTYKIGKKVKVLVSGVNISKRNIDFEFVD